MKIVSLTAENVKKLTAVHIEPSGSVVIIGGENDQGKTSVLDSIMYALSGNSIPANPLRNGTDKGRVTVDIGNYVVTRKFSRKDDKVTSSLEIKTKEGFKASSPQSILDELCGRLAFDPLEFLRLKPKAQLEALRELVGIDFTELDKHRAQAFANRTEINRQVKAKEAELAACPKVPAPDDEVSVAALTDQLAIMERKSKAQDDVRNALQTAINNRMAAEVAVDETRAEIERLQKLLHVRELRAVECQRSESDALKAVKELTPIDCESVRDQLRQAETTNRAVRQNEKHNKLQEQLDDLIAHAASLTETVESFDQQKVDKMAAAKFPVPGLGFDDNGVTYNGLPFDKDYQSGANMIRVATAMGMALNPKLRVMMVRDASLLGKNNLEILCEMAEEQGFQLWLERVGVDATCSVIIEDGHVLEPVAV